ncbi:MAG: MobV family relaxase [Lactococcus lactis]
MKDQPNFLSENGPSPAKKSFDRLTKQPTYFRLLQVDGFPLVSAVSRTLLASQSTHLTKVRYSVLYFTWKLCRRNQKRSACPMSMVVARMQKMKAENLTGIGSHNQRKTDNHSNKDIDVSKSHLNYDLVHQTQNYKKDIEQFIHDKRTGSRAIRKDAVLVNEWIISSDRLFFERLNEQETKHFFEATKDYFAEKFGNDNIRYATVHLDETTPHMHLGIVPFDRDNKLSAKRVFNREALRDVQEDLPKHLQALNFDIERGQKGSERKNLSVPEFKEMKQEQQEIQYELRQRKMELAAYIKENNLSLPIDHIKVKKEKETVKIPSGEKILGIDVPKKVERTTGNVIMSEDDYKQIQQYKKHVSKTQATFVNLLYTDIYAENKSLKDELIEQKEKNNKNIDDYNDLSNAYNDLIDENTLLKAHISDLKQEIKLIYTETKAYLKERASDIQHFKELFKSFVSKVLISVKGNDLDSQFKKEVDRDRVRKRDRGISR